MFDETHTGSAHHKVSFMLKHCSFSPGGLSLV
jgi:hypothetical protein